VSELRWNAAPALIAWAEPSSAALFRALVAAEDDDVLRGPALRGLGLTGAQTDVPAILAHAEDEPEEVLRALSLLVGRSFEDVAEFQAWWEDHSKDAKLAQAALHAAGADAERLDEMAAVPTLIALLDDARLPVRWNAYRALQTITSASLGTREVLYEGRVQNPEQPDVELDLARVLSDGWTVFYTGGAAFHMVDMKPLRDLDGGHRWSRAQTQWQHWWDERKPK
jgi:HEAT repeat protein